MIYYSHVNEDNLLEKNILKSDAYKNLFCVAGSGERLLALLGNSNLQNVFVVDANEEALFLTELKVKALQYLRVEEYLAFVGFASSSQKTRFATFQQFSNRLSPACRKFWEENASYLEEGILQIGHFERFLKTVRPILKAWLGKSFYQLFQQSKASLKGFPTLRWEILKCFFAQTFTYRLFGNKDVAFVGKKAALECIPQGIEKTIEENCFDKSFMNHLIFHGDLSNMRNADLPLSLNEAYLKKVKLQLQKVKLQYIHNDLLKVLKQMDSLFFDHAFFSLSDLLSFVDVNYLVALLKEIKNKGNTKNRVILRAFARNRLDEYLIQDYLQDFGSLKDLSPMERTRIYQVFDLKISHEK